MALFNLINASVVNLAIIMGTILGLYFFLLNYSLKHDDVDSDFLIVSDTLSIPNSIQVIAGIFVGLMAFVISNHGIPIADFRPVDVRYLPVYFAVYYGSPLIGSVTAVTLIITKCFYYYLEGGTITEISNNFLITLMILFISIVITKKKLSPRKAIYLCLALTIAVRSIFFIFAFYNNFNAYTLLQICTNFLIFSVLFLFTGWLVQKVIATSEDIHVYRTSSTFDSLTGLYNKESFYFFLDLAYNEAIHEGRAFSLAIIDFDNFKKINDLFGHLTGDKVLVDVANLLKSNLSPNSRIRACRIGGDELAIVFKHEEYDATQFFETLYQQLEELTYEPSLKEHITVSVGLIDFHPVYSEELQETSQTVQDLFHAADNALYEAKKQGKNQIIQLNKTIEIVTKKESL